MTVASTAPAGGGIGRRRWIVNAQVPSDYCPAGPRTPCGRAGRRPRVCPVQGWACSPRPMWPIGGPGRRTAGSRWRPRSASPIRRGRPSAAPAGSRAPGRGRSTWWPSCPAALSRGRPAERPVHDRPRPSPRLSSWPGSRGPGRPRTPSPSSAPPVAPAKRSAAPGRGGGHRWPVPSAPRCEAGCGRPEGSMGRATMITLVLGGARSGKSTVAERLVGRHPDPVTYVATMVVGDDPDLGRPGGSAPPAPAVRHGRRSEAGPATGRHAAGSGGHGAGRLARPLAGGAAGHGASTPTPCARHWSSAAATPWWSPTRWAWACIRRHPPGRQFRDALGIAEPGGGVRGRPDATWSSPGGCSHS